MGGDEDAEGGHGLHVKKTQRPFRIRGLGVQHVHVYCGTATLKSASSYPYESSTKG